MKIEITRRDAQFVTRALRSYRSEAIQMKKMAQDRMLSQVCYECDIVISHCDSIVKDIEESIREDYEEGES